MSMRALVLLFALGCVEDYATPGKGSIGVAGIEACKADRYQPCGWVYWFEAPQMELCIIWDDRALVLGHPPHLLQAAESLYGGYEISRAPRFAGAPLCNYQCPPTGPGCNALAPGGCLCLEESP
jgi:hypothetical protein